MLLTIILSILAIIGMFLCIFLKPSIKIGKFQTDTFYLPILLVALILLIFPIFDKTELLNTIFSNSSLNPIKILILFICVSFISIALDETGFFRFIANVFINKFKKSQKALFLILYALISVLTVFTSNDIVILTFTPFILYFSKQGKIKPIPYLVMEFVAANTYSMMLSIGNPTNIYLASIFDIPFLDYFIKMVLPALACGIVSLAVLLLLFKKPLKDPILPFEMNENKINNKPLCIVCGIHLALTTILLAISNYINLEMWIICLSFAVSLILVLTVWSVGAKNKQIILAPAKRVPYSLIPFILSMFTIIMALNSFDIFKNISNIFEMINNDYLKSITYLTTSTLACNIVNNIPMTLAYGSILSNTNNITLIYATIIGSNLGALLTPVGALAGIMWIRILKTNDVKYTFIDFIKNGSIITLTSILTASLCLLIM